MPGASDCLHSSEECVQFQIKKDGDKERWSKSKEFFTTLPLDTDTSESSSVYTSDKLNFLWSLILSLCVGGRHLTQKEIHGIVWCTEAVTEEKPDLCLLHINIPLSILHVIFSCIFSKGLNLSLCCCIQFSWKSWRTLLLPTSRPSGPIWLMCMMWESSDLLDYVNIADVSQKGFPKYYCHCCFRDFTCTYPLIMLCIPDW